MWYADLVSRFTAWRIRRLKTLISRDDARIDALTARMDHAEPFSPLWERLEGERVQAWWGRNELHHKLYRLKEAR